MRLASVAMWAIFWRMPFWTAGFIWGLCMLTYFSIESLLREGRDDALRAFVNKHKINQPGVE